MPAGLSVNYFSPLPPQPTDIGNHALGVASELAARAEVTLWTDQAEWDARIERTAPVRRFDPAAPPFREMNRADANIYNLGNNAAFHRGIFHLARRVPGVVVLHDTRLQHFFGALGAAGGAEREVYLAAMRRFHGEEATAAAHRFFAGELPFEELVLRYPMTLAAVDRAIAVIVHNPAEHRALLARVRVPLYLQPLSFPAGAVPDRRAPVGDRMLRLVVFGFIGANRRVASIVEALAGMPDRGRFALDVYGPLEDERLVDEPVERHGMQGQVTRHGFVEEAILDTALAGADLVLNLRHPTMGEASGSQLRIWRAAAPSLVTRTGWYATLPEDAVFFVEPDSEIESIRVHLAALRREPVRFARAGRRGREVLEREHSPVRYAAALLNIAREGPAQHGRRQGIDLARRAAGELLQIMEAPAVATVSRAVAEAVRDLVAPPEPPTPGQDDGLEQGRGSDASCVEVSI
jgi:glycosyltransferase involved in cell wall biosynthesis